MSAFLVFVVQPMAAKAILPRYGGTPAVWTTCMVFFQTVLLAGYAYAHFLTTRLTRRTQQIVHVSALCLAILFMPLGLARSRGIELTHSPGLSILLTLGIGLGVPYLVLSSTAPLLQAWSGAHAPVRRLYSLYAVSNVGSFVGLVAYPFLIEPALSTDGQFLTWSVLFVAYSVLILATLRRAQDLLPAARAAADLAEGPASASRRVLWLGLATMSSVILLAITNYLCQDIAVIPFLWVLPLTVYLLTFVLAFSGVKLLSRFWLLTAVVASVVAMSIVRTTGIQIPTVGAIGVQVTLLFLCCMLCHGELYALRPGVSRLTSFYLTVATGGALGAVAVGLIAPVALDRYVELPLGIQGCFLLMVAAALRERGWAVIGTTPQRKLSMAALACLAGAALVLSYFSDTRPGAIVSSRNFFGVLHVVRSEVVATREPIVALFHGSTIHGFQFTARDKQEIPTSYYGGDSGIGLVLGAAATGGRKICVVGLGVGTIAAYGRAGDEIRFYEINPSVIDLARTRFSFLRLSKASIRIIEGDARLVLENEESQGCDSLILDAFTSDAIPVHLLTKEAFDVYLRHLKERGIIIVNISNRYLDLKPVLRSVSAHYGMKSRAIRADSDPAKGSTASEYFLMTRDGSLPVVKGNESTTIAASRSTAEPLWTDNFSNLFRALK